MDLIAGTIKTIFFWGRGGEEGAAPVSVAFRWCGGVV